ncbi:glycosyl hydrolase family 16 [Polaribacter litorisediminis]|uniref:glycosyl hydrolase family 16 n=1 Tax=Polaribacter litorisediminis TaxID=1908341 RepID=UPI001CC0B817|nr:glycosyl hydrolase family 16 [Polaribacter litorisediminis]UAM99176.1 glycosyl hydrolase family 16 [Polaribacter litorisediminis]
MKKTKFINAKITLLLGLGFILFTSCEREISDQALPATFNSSGEIFGDAPSGLTDDFFISFDPAGGANTEGFGTDETIFYEGTSSIKIAVPAPNDPNGGFIGGIFRDRGEGRDLSGYDALTFYAKGSTTGTIGQVGFGTDFLDGQYPVTRSNIQLTTDWKKYVIPIPDPSKLTQEKGMFLFAAGGLDIIDNVPNGNEIGWTFWLDEIRFEKLGTIGQARPMIYNGQDVAEDVFTGSQIFLNDLKESFQLGTGEVVTVNPSYNYFTFSSSDSNIINTDNLLFDPSGNPYVEVLDAGSTTISATLNNVAAEGSFTANSLGEFVTAPDPTRPQEDVISIFSDAYPGGVTNLNIAAYNDSNITISAPIANGNQYINYENLNFVGLGWDGTVNASQMTHLHVDVQITSSNAKNFIVEIIDFGPNNENNGFGGTDDSAGGFLVSSNQLIEGQWISLDIPLTSFTRSTGGGGGGRPNVSNIGHVGFVSLSLDSFLIDNVYFYK